MAWSGYISDLLSVGGFELGGAEVSQAAVQAAAVVPADVLGDGVACGGPGGPGLQVDQLAFYGAEKALSQGVVPALARAPCSILWQGTDTLAYPCDRGRPL